MNPGNTRNTSVQSICLVQEHACVHVWIIMNPPLLSHFHIKVWAGFADTYARCESSPYARSAKTNHFEFIEHVFFSIFLRNSWYQL